MGYDLILRRWTNSDCRMIYDWRMNPAVRQRSLNKSEFPYSEHEVWFNNFMTKKESFGYILEDSHRPVAQIRFDKTKIDGYFNVSIFTAPGLTGKGYGSAILKLACADKELLSVAKYFVAEVFEDNVPSKKIFTKNGFQITGEATLDGSHKILLFKRQAI